MNGQHLSLTERILYVNAIRENKLDTVPKAIYDHVKTCFECYCKVNDLLDITEVMEQSKDVLTEAAENQIKKDLERRDKIFTRNRKVLERERTATVKREGGRTSPNLSVFEPEMLPLYIVEKDKAVSFKIHTTAPKADMFIFNEKGEKVLQTTFKSSCHIDIQSLKSGVYFWRIITDDDNQTGKFYICKEEEISQIKQSPTLV